MYTLYVNMFNIIYLYIYARCMRPIAISIERPRIYIILYIYILIFIYDVLIDLDAQTARDL